MSLDWSRREGESKMRVLPTVGGYARLMMRQASPRRSGHERRCQSEAGLLGLTAALPARQGRRAGTRLRGVRRGLGGLAGTSPLDGIDVDRYYHAVTLDRPARDRPGHGARARATRSAGGRSAWASSTTAALASMSTPRELLPLPGPERWRTARGSLRSSPAARLISDHGQAGRRADRGLDAPPQRRRALGAALAAAARLEVRRPLRRPSRHLPVVAHAPHGRHPGPLRPRGDGLDPTAATRRSRTRWATRYARTRRRGAHRRRRCARSCRREGRVQGVVVGRRLQAPRLGGLDAAAAAPVADCWRPDLEAALPAGPVPLPRRRLRRGARARAA